MLVTVRLVLFEFPWKRITCGKVEWNKSDRVRSALVALDGHQELDLTSKYWILLEAGSTKGFADVLRGSAPFFCGEVLSAERMPEIISVLAPLLIEDQDSTQWGTLFPHRRVLRIFSLPVQLPTEKINLHSTEKDKGVEVSIYEEMGESIARHIWSVQTMVKDDAMILPIHSITGVLLTNHRDAALGLLASCMEKPIFGENLAAHMHQLPQLLMPYFDISARKAKGNLEILELGAGCGIVGLSLARLVPNARFVLTDLPEALEILDENATRMAELGLAPGTSIITKILDWNSSLENTLPAGNTDSDIFPNLAGLRPDLVIVSDCTYNPSSFQALVATLLQSVRQGHKHNPRGENMKLDVLVSYKSRHESESQFFDDMLNLGFHVLSHKKVEFPDRTRELVGLDVENAEIFAFGWQNPSN